MLATLEEGAISRDVVLSVAGEASPPDLIDRWARDRRMFNSYGPAETTVDATLWHCDPDAGDVAIGRPGPTRGCSCWTVSWSRSRSGW